MPYTQKVEVGALVLLWCPAEGVDIAVPVFCDIYFGSCFAVVYAELVPVRLIAIACHRLPCNVFPVGRILRILVVAGVVETGSIAHGLFVESVCRVHLRLYIAFGLADVFGLARTYIIYEDVRVGRYGIIQAFLLAAGVGYLLRVGAPCQLLDAAKRLHRTFVGLTFKQIRGIVGNDIVTDTTEEWMLDAFYIVVPVAIHQVGHVTSGGFGQVVGILLYDVMEWKALDDDNLSAVG